MRVRAARNAAGLLAALAASGCASLGERIAHPDGGSLLDPGAVAMVERVWGITPERMTTPDGVGIAYLLIPPADRGFSYDITRKDGWNSATFKSSHDPEAVPIRGSIVYLHGRGMDATSMLPWALALSESGYRGVAMDLRNHGNSDKAPAGFGVREAKDLVALVQDLQARGELPPPVYLFGVSLGASTALFAEPDLRDSIAGIVAMEPYANAADAIRGVVPGMLGEEVHGMSNRLAQGWARLRFGPEDIEPGIIEAGRILGMDLARVDLHATVARSQTCSLLLHGAEDGWVDPEGSRELAGLSTEIRFREVPGEGHLSLPLRIDWLVSPIIRWLGHAGTGECVPFALPADPLTG